MKKALLALLIGSAIALSGCEDEQLVQKLLEAEKQIVQLQNEKKHVQQQLAEQVAVLEKSKEKIPALKVEIVPLFNQSSSVKHQKTAENEYDFESFVSVFASTVKTGVKWLDQLVLQSIYLPYIAEQRGSAFKDNMISEEEVIEYFQNMHQTLQAEAKEFQPIGLSQSVNVYYIGQRNNLVTFMPVFSSYGGGAHGIYQSYYLNIDVNKQAIVTLDDIVKPQHQAKLLQLLWQRYSGVREEPFMAREDMFISEQFYFTPHGVQFVYPVYSLGSFAEGEIELFVHFTELKEMMNPEYFPTEKDGFGLDKSLENY